MGSRQAHTPLPVPLTPVVLYRLRLLQPNRVDPPTHLYISDDMKEVGESLLSSATASPRRASPSGPFLSRGRYKLWALAAVLLLALWSMLAGTFTLKWSARRPSDDLDGPLLEDVDVLVRRPSRPNPFPPSSSM
ncbi:hypothetical protein BHE74_00014143 [Ensete ventricosum]|nr:hypothetical protein GW17_00035988 [Ensete ventricosum]RWW77684.1 hypothetical protein BHE74_00014143 [Ensete ventricosum]RZR92921.1 hypothetical protein BHM03_00021307 [Ensete ventricosum]